MIQQMIRTYVTSCDFCQAATVVDVAIEGSIACPVCQARLLVEAVVCKGCGDRILPLPQLQDETWVDGQGWVPAGFVCTYCMEAAGDAQRAPDGLPWGSRG